MRSNALTMGLNNSRNLKNTFDVKKTSNLRIMIGELPTLMRSACVQKIYPKLLLALSCL